MLLGVFVCLFVVVVVVVVGVAADVNPVTD